MPDKADDAALLSQGKKENAALRKKDRKDRTLSMFIDYYTPERVKQMRGDKTARRLLLALIVLVLVIIALCILLGVSLSGLLWLWEENSSLREQAVSAISLTQV